MKLIKKMRKGFTLIELVVVIAVIAILSAVTVVSYIAITNKAKQSSDEQAVRQMNTILQANSVMDLKSINDVYAAFAENGLSVENYKPLYKDRYFFWDSTTNQIVYTDENYVVIYPENLKGQTKGDHQWYSLTQALAKVTIKDTDTVTVPGKSEPQKVKEIVAATSTEPAQYNYAVSEPEQLYTIGEELKQAMLQAPSGNSTTSSSISVSKESSVTYIVGDITIDLTQDLDLMGAAFNFCVKGNFVLNGHGHKITGIVNNRDFVVGSSKGQTGATQEERYGTGIVGYVANPKSGVRGTALFKDVSVENCVFGYSEGKGAGLIGYAKDSDVTFENVSMKNCSCEGFEHSVGGFVGDTQGGVTITLNGANEVKNTSLRLTEGTDSVKECYGAGYFIGRQTNEDLVVTVSEGASFTQSGNSKTYNTKQNAAGKTSYFYWDDAVKENRKAVNL